MDAREFTQSATGRVEFTIVANFAADCPSPASTTGGGQIHQIIALFYFRAALFFHFSKVQFTKDDMLA